MFIWTAFLLVCTSCVYSLRYKVLSSRSSTSCRMDYKPTTYSAVSVPYHNKVQDILVNDAERILFAAVKGLKPTSSPEQDAVVDTWIENGQAFFSTPEGTRSMHRTELNQKPPLTSSGPRKYRRRWLAADLYVQCGSDRLVSFERAPYFSFGYSHIYRNIFVQWACVCRYP